MSKIRLRSNNLDENPKDNVLLEYLQGLYDRDMKTLSEFEKLQKKKLSAGRQHYIDNSVLTFRARRDLLEEIITWLKQNKQSK